MSRLSWFTCGTSHQFIRALSSPVLSIDKPKGVHPKICQGGLFPFPLNPKEINPNPSCRFLPRPMPQLKYQRKGGTGFTLFRPIKVTRKGTVNTPYPLPPTLYLGKGMPRRSDNRRFLDETCRKAAFFKRRQHGETPAIKRLTNEIEPDILTFFRCCDTETVRPH